MKEKDDIFSVIIDIFAFMNKDKYKTKIDLYNILQSTEDLVEIIEKVSVYFLDITFDNINFVMKMLSKRIHSIIILL